MQNKTKGFTLIEILIALFVFTILSLIMTGALHNIIQAQAGAEKTAENVRRYQMVWLLISRDIEQTINRPISRESGEKEAAFVGNQDGFSFTHMGIANFDGRGSTLQRTMYFWHQAQLWRATWAVLDRINDKTIMKKPLLNEIKQAQFEYIDEMGKIHREWPNEDNKAPLPSGVRISLLTPRGEMSQTYVIEAKASQAIKPPTPPQP